MYTIATFVIVGLFCLKDLSRATTCGVMTKNVNEPKVATMCKNSSVSGTVVYVDTDLANLAGTQSGLVCWCSIKIQHGKQMNSTMYYPGNVHETCGTTIKYEDDTDIQNQGLCLSNGASVLVQTPRHMNMSLYRRFSSNISTFCFRLELKYCDDYSYQCDDGTCINSFGRCDAFPDCIDGSDEENCGPIACVEGQVPCDDNTKCIGSDERCDDIAHCHDHSDESAKYCDPNYIEPEHDPPSPLITVECDDSPFIIATTTTTTTPPTTTSTPTTTTTPPTTTTTTSPTTTTTPPTTTTTTSPTTTTTPPTTTTTTSPTTTTTPPTTTTTSRTTTKSTTPTTTTTLPITTTATSLTTSTTPPTTTTTTSPTTTTTPPTTRTTTSPTTSTTPPTTTTTTSPTTTTAPPTTRTTTSPTTTITFTTATTTATLTSTTQNLPPVIKTESTNKTIAIGVSMAVTAIIAVPVAIGVYCYYRHRNRLD